MQQTPLLCALGQTPWALPQPVWTGDGLFSGDQGDKSTILYIISLQWACLPLCKTTIKVYTAHSITGALTEMVFSRGPGRRKLLYTWPAGREPLGCSTQEEPQEADMAPIACHSTCATGCQDMHVCAHVCSKWPGVRSVAGLSCTVSKQMNE